MSGRSRADRADGGPVPPHRRRRSPKPVFLDRSGRRRRVVVAAGAAAGVLVLFALVALVAGMFGASPLHLPGLPDPDRPATDAGGPSQSPTTDQEPTGQPSVMPDPTLPTQAASGEPGTPRNNPTHTPTHRPRPTKT